MRKYIPKNSNRPNENIENFFDLVNDTIEDGIWMADEKDIIYYVNSGMEKIAGVSKDKIIGKNVVTDFPKETTFKFNKFYQKAKSELKPIWYEIELTTLNGRESWQNGWILPVVKEKQYKGIIVTIRDVTSSKKAEETLKHSEKKFKSIYHNSPDMYVSVSPDNALVLDCNNTLLTKTGYLRNDVVGEPVFKLYHLDCEEEVHKAFQLFIETGEVTNKELVLKRKDGSKIYVSLNVSSVRDERGNIMHSISSWRDISDRIINRKKLIEEKNRAKQYLDIAGVIMLGLDADGIVQLVNKKGCEILGYEEEEIVGKKWADHFLPEDEKLKIKQNREDALSGNFEYYKFHENNIQAKNGEKHLIAWKNSILRNDEGKLIGTLSSGEDITLKRQIVNELKESEVRFRSLFKNAPLPYHSLNEEGCFIEINPQWLATLGYERHEVIGKYYGDFLHPEWKLHFEKKFPELKKRGSVQTKFKIRHKNGYYLDIELNGNIATNLNGTFRQTNCVFQDITERKEAERRLKESEYKFRLLADNTQDWEYWINEKNDYVFISPSCKTITGYSEKEFYEDKELFFRLLHPDDAEHVTTHFSEEEQKNTEEVHGLEFRIIAKDGTLKWLEHNCNPLYNESGKYVGRRGNNRDISKRKNTEEKHRIVVESAMDGYWIIDLDGRFLEVNEVYQRMSGFSKNELLRMNVKDLDAKLTDEEFKHIIVNAKKDKTARLERKHTRKDGSIFDAEVGLRYLNMEGGRVACFIHDITQRKKAEYELTLNENRLNALVQLNEMRDQSLDQVYNYTLDKAIELTNSKIGFLGFVNASQTIVTVYNWSDSAMQECKVADMSMDFDVEKSGIWGEVVRTQKVLVLNDYKQDNPLKKGIPHGHVPIKNYLSIPVVENRKVVAMVSVSNKETDYTDIDAKQLALLLSGMWKFVAAREEQEKLKEAKEKAVEADRLKSAFLANMSHEIRTPMNGILGFTSLLQEPNLSGEEQQTYINIIKESGDRLLTTVNDIIEISKIETGQIGMLTKEYNLNEQLEFYYNFFVQEAEEKGLQLSLRNKLNNREAFIYTDELKLNSILTNLIKNAIKYTKTGSIDISCERKERFLLFSVKDTGIGVAPERHAAIFDRFVQADLSVSRGYEGAGLGLAIVKSYVEMLGGEIWVESEIGEGSEFFFTIEYWPVEHDVQVPQSQEKVVEKLEKSINILVAEDDAVSYLLMENILAGNNFNLIWAKDGQQAIKAFNTHANIHLILMDIKMPELDGIEATQEIRKMNKTVPIIAQTAHVLGGDKEKAIEAGCNAYIAKPIVKATLLEMIERYVKE